MIRSARSSCSPTPAAAAQPTIAASVAVSTSGCGYTTHVSANAAHSADVAPAPAVCSGLGRGW